MATTVFRMRPTFHHRRDSIEAHLTVVSAACTIGRDLKNHTGVSIRWVIREFNPVRDVINALGQDLTAITTPGPAGADLLAPPRRSRVPH